MSIMRDDLTMPHREDPEAAEELIALGTTRRARVQGRTFTPSVHSRPLPGSVERPVHDENEEGDDA